jgi:WD40 repeat protein
MQGAFEGINCVRFTKDQAFVLGGESRQAIRVWRVANGRLERSLTGHTGKVVGLSCSMTHVGTVVSCSTDRTIKVRQSGLKSST